MSQYVYQIMSEISSQACVRIDIKITGSHHHFRLNGSPQYFLWSLADPQFVSMDALFRLFHQNTSRKLYGEEVRTMGSHYHVWKQLHFYIHSRNWIWGCWGVGGRWREKTGNRAVILVYHCNSYLIHKCPSQDINTKHINFVLSSADNSVKAIVLT